MKLELCTYGDLEKGDSYIENIKESPMFIIKVKKIIPGRSDSKIKIIAITNFNSEFEEIKYKRKKVLKVLTI